MLGESENGRSVSSEAFNDNMPMGSLATTEVITAIHEAAKANNYIGCWLYPLRSPLHPMIPFIGRWQTVRATPISQDGHYLVFDGDAAYVCERFYARSGKLHLECDLAGDDSRYGHILLAYARQNAIS